MKRRNLSSPSYLLIAILVAAAVLRLNHINQPLIDPFSWRQASTAMMADNFYHKNWNIFYPEVNWHGPGPSYQGREFQTVTYIAALLYVLVGHHDWVGRAVAVAFGLWGIFALYQLVRCVWDEKHAVASAAIMALLSGSIFVERSFLPDPAMVALVVTSFWLLVVYLQTQRLHYLLLAGIVGLLGFLTKITGLIVGIPMIYAVLTIYSRKQILHLRKLVTIGIAAILILIPMAAYYLWARHLSLTYPPYHFAGSGNWLWDDGLQQWFNQQYYLPKLYWNFDTWIWTKPIIALVCIGLLLTPPGEQRYKKTTSDLLQMDSSGLSLDGIGRAPWLFHWWFLGGVFYYFVGAKELVENPWNFHIVNPAAAALAGHAIIAVASFVSRAVQSSISTRISLLSAALLLLLIGTSGQNGLKYMYKSYIDESYKLGLALNQITQPDDLVVTIPNDIGDPTSIYYSQRTGWLFPPAQPGQAWTQLPKDDNEAIRLFEELRAKGADWLGVVNEHIDDLRNNHAMLVRHIERTCEFKSKSKDWIIYRIRTPEEVATLSHSP